MGKEYATEYKYYGLSDYNIDAVEKNYLYASSHLELNDPFDSMNNLVCTKNAPLPYLFQFYEKLGHNKEEIRNNPEEFRNKLQLDFALWLSNAFGILSLTNNPINTQMWPSRRVSNFLYEGYDGILNFMQSEKWKGKLKK